MKHYLFAAILGQSAARATACRSRPATAATTLPS